MDAYVDYMNEVKQYERECFSCTEFAECHIPLNKRLFSNLQEDSCSEYKSKDLTFCELDTDFSKKCSKEYDDVECSYAEYIDKYKSDAFKTQPSGDKEKLGNILLDNGRFLLINSYHKQDNAEPLKKNGQGL